MVSHERLMELVVTEAAQESIGIYPGAVLGGDKPYEKRTEYMDGWNACLIEIGHKAAKLSAWFAALPSGVRPLIEQSVIRQHVEVSAFQETVTLQINCNDLFYWGCGDAEDVPVEEIQSVVDAYRASPFNGGLLWVCRKRKMRPQGAFYTSFPEAEWPLFDACGPEREIDFGNPKDRHGTYLYTEACDKPDAGTSQGGGGVS